MPRPTLLVLFYALATSCLSAQSASLKSVFEAELSQHGVVGGAVAVVHAQQPTEMHFYGKQNVDQPQQIDSDTAYNWASITKTMTAISILQLRDRGKISLDDSVVRYVPELHQVHDDFGPVDKITIRQLLTHSAGFRNPTWPWDCESTENCEWQPFEPTQWSQVVAMLPYTRVAFAPGSQWSYSNLGYVFLGQIIERLTGDDFEVYVTKNILMPLGMTASYFDRAPYFLEQHVSASYLRAGKKLTPQPFNFDTGITTSNSGLKAPVVDMVKYLEFLLGDAQNPRYEIVLARKSLDEAWTGEKPVYEPGKVATPYTDGSPQMGLGFFTTEIQGHRYVFHDGDQGGFSAEMLIDPEHHTGALLMVNTTDTGAPDTSSHAVSNTEPEPGHDLRLAIRHVLISDVFPAAAK